MAGDLKMIRIPKDLTSGADHPFGFMDDTFTLGSRPNFSRSSPFSGSFQSNGLSPP